MTFCQEKTFLKGCRITNLKTFLLCCIYEEDTQNICKTKDRSKTMIKFRKKKSRSFLNNNYGFVFPHSFITQHQKTEFLVNVVSSSFKRDQQLYNHPTHC